MNNMSDTPSTERNVAASKEDERLSRISHRLEADLEPSTENGVKQLLGNSCKKPYSERGLEDMLLKVPYSQPSTPVTTHSQIYDVRAVSPELTTLDPVIRKI